MLVSHLTLAGGVEFALTFGVIAYLQRANLPILRINHDNVPETDADLVRPPAPPQVVVRGLLPIAVMALATPLGLIYNSGAYGETDVKADPKGFLQKNHLSAIPAGLNHYANFWHHALFNGYDFSHDKHPAARLHHLRLLRGRGHLYRAVRDLWRRALGPETSRPKRETSTVMDVYPANA